MAPTPSSDALTHRTSVNAEAKKLAQHAKAADTQYGRGEKIRTKSIKDKKLRSNMKALEAKNKEAILQAKNAEILLDQEAGLLETEHELERTYKVRQDEIQNEVGIETAKKRFELRLDMGPYDVGEYTRNGRDLLIASRKGHLACMDWREGKLGCELQLNETIRDAKWLHNNQQFAVAQKNCVYIYARDGVEIHQLKKHQEATHLEFLPYHFLLSSISTAGMLRYTDTSTGQMLTEIPTKLGQPTSFCQNPYNAVLLAGHQRGHVTLWSPNTQTPLVKLLTRPGGPVRALAVDKSGKYMISASQDRCLSIWDLRMVKQLHSHHLKQPAHTISISDRNVTAVGWGSNVSIYKPDIFSLTPDSNIRVPTPYMNWSSDSFGISRVRYCPFEDVLGISHEKGFSSIIVPGAGEPNPDSLEPGTNPFENTKQRQEAEVHALLEKLQPEMISLNPNFIGNLDLASEEQRRKERDLDAKPEDKIAKIKNKQRGKNSGLKKFLRKSGQKNVITEEKARAREALQTSNKKMAEKFAKDQKAYGPALARFARKGY